MLLVISWFLPREKRCPPWDLTYSYYTTSILPIVLEENKINELIEYSKRKEKIEINLSEQEIIFGNKRIKFDIDPYKKKCLLGGLDDIALSLEKSEKISLYEEKVKKDKPWIN